MRTTWGDHERFVNTYFTTFKNMYFTGDGCRVDADGDYWLLGRVDDVVNVSGHRIGTAEVESALVSHAKVAEAAVAPMPHDIKGQALYAFVTLKDGIAESEELKKELANHVRKEIGAIAVPDKIQFAPGLPKTRSGKIMRRILRKIAENQTDQIGDVSTLADPRWSKRWSKGNSNSPSLLAKLKSVTIRAMKFALAIFTYLVMAAILGAGIFLAAVGKPVFLVIAFIAFCVAFGRLGCMSH